MLIIHGDNIVGSRNLLNQKIQEYKSKGIKDIVRLDGKKVKVEELKQALESQSLFGSDRLVVVEGIISRQKSKDKQTIIEYLKTNNYDALIIWEAKSITKTQTKPFKHAIVQEFKTPTVIFKFLESLGGNQAKTGTLFQDCIQKDSPESVFFMLSRQIRLLLQTTDPNIKMAPWQKNKLIRQAKTIGETKLLNLHPRLLRIDESIKTGKSILGMQGELELLLASL